MQQERCSLEDDPHIQHRKRHPETVKGRQVVSDPVDEWLNPIPADQLYSEFHPASQHLKIANIDVTPLDAQLGQWPLKSVPDSLTIPLFGKLGQTAFFVIHPQEIAGGVETIEDCGLPYRSLFKGQGALERKEETPHVIQLEKDAVFTRKLFTDHKAGFGFWGKKTGLLLTTQASLQKVCEHFRLFTQFQDQNGQWLYFRFWDGTIFVDYWRQFATSQHRVARFFYTRDFRYIFTLYMQSDAGLTCIEPTLDLTIPPAVSKKPFSLDAEDFAFFQAQVDQKLKAQVVSDLKTCLADAPSEKQQHINAAVEYAFEFIKTHSRGAPVRAQDCMTLSFLVLMWDTMTTDILSGPVFAEPLVPIGHKIELAKMTYFESLNHLAAGRH